MNFAAGDAKIVHGRRCCGGYSVAIEDDGDVDGGEGMGPTQSSLRDELERREEANGGSEGSNAGNDVFEGEVHHLESAGLMYTNSTIHIESCGEDSRMYQYEEEQTFLHVHVRRSIVILPHLYLNGCFVYCNSTRFRLDA